MTKIFFVTVLKAKRMVRLETTFNVSDLIDCFSGSGEPSQLKEILALPLLKEVPISTFTYLVDSWIAT